MVYLVTFDINKTGDAASYARANVAINGALDKLLTIKDPGLDSVRFVSTAWSANELYNYLSPHISKKDRIIIVKMIGTGLHQGLMHPDIWKWINANL